jgi:hypothetical protein
MICPRWGLLVGRPSAAARRDFSRVAAYADNLPTVLVSHLSVVVFGSIFSAYSVLVRLWTVELRSPRTTVVLDYVTISFDCLVLLLSLSSPQYQRLGKGWSGVTSNNKPYRFEFTTMD